MYACYQPVLAACVLISPHPQSYTLDHWNKTPGCAPNLKEPSWPPSSFQDSWNISAGFVKLWLKTMNQLSCWTDRLSDQSLARSSELCRTLYFCQILKGCKFHRSLAPLHFKKKRLFLLHWTWGDHEDFREPFIPLLVSHWSCGSGSRVGDTLCFDVLKWKD